MAYRLGYNGPEVDKLLQKAYTYSVVNNGWSKLESSDTDPADLNTLVTPGNYSVSFWKNGPVQMNTSGPINICITKDSATGKVYQTIHDAGKIYIRETTSSSFSNTWKEEQNDTELDISSAEPINPVDNYIWIDPSDDVPVIKIYKESTGTWENISPSDMAKQSIYDNKGVKQNINTYLTNKIAEADLETAENAYESHIVEGEAEGNPIHVTDKEKLKWSNGISTEDAQPYITALETEMTSYADEKINTKATSVNSIESTINDDKTKINAHINDNTVHLTAKQVEEFNNKAAGDHKHLNNGSVTVSASNIVGQIPIARLDPSVLERNYTVTTYNEMLSLTKTEVQNGDSVYINSDTPSAWFVIDDTKLGTTDAFIQYASPNPELTWDNIINKPTSISEYGVTDVYLKEEIDALYNEIMTSLNKSKEIADAFSANVTTTIPSDLSDTYKNNLLLASELNTKLDETLHSLGYDDTMINDMINMYKNRNLKLKTTQEPMIKKSIVIDYINDDNSPYSLTKEELPNCEVFALDSSDNISAMHTVDETYYPGYKKELPDGTGCYVFDGWKRKDLDIPEGETSKEVKVYYVYMNPSTDTLPAEVVSNKPNTADYNLNYLENPSDIHTIDDTHYPEGYSVTTEDGSGTWTFSGWTRLPKSTVDKTVTYEYTINGDKSILPTEVITNKPTDSNYTISLVNPTTEVHTVDDIHYPEGYEIDSTDKSGVWTFSGWGGGNCNIIPINFSALTLGSTFNFGKYQVESETPWSIEWEIVHQTDDYQIAQTKQIIDLRCFDAKEPTNTDSDRSKYGNNNWQYSNIKQFLNSDQATWYSAQHSYDAPPNSTNVYNGINPYDTHKGFLYYFSDEEKSLLKDITFDLFDYNGGGSYTWTGKVWLPTYTQMGFGNNNISEGIKFDKYNSSSDRIKYINKYCAENNKYCIDNNYSEGTNWDYWMSSADPSYSFNAWRVRGDSDCNSVTAFSGYFGLAPCICLPRK